MSIIKRMRKQKAVWWQVTGTDRDGDPIFAAGVEVDCRWEDKAVKFQSPSGEEKVSRAIVYVDRIMKPGDMLWRGTAADADDLADPHENDDVGRIDRFDQLPKLRNDETLYTAFL